MPNPQFAEDHGWPEWCGELYPAAVAANPDDDIWRNEDLPTFTAASFWLASRVNLYSQMNDTGMLGIVERLTSTAGIEFNLLKLIRELFQNAKDAAPDDEILEAKLEFSDDAMTWEHNGRAFRGPRGAREKAGEMAALFNLGVTTKRGRFDLEGRFGIGFKGWIIFFKSVDVYCSDGDIAAEVGWTIDGLDVTDPRYLGPERCNADGTITRFSFRRYRKVVATPSVDDILSELSKMVRFLDFDVIINVIVNGDRGSIEHRCEGPDEMQGGFPVRELITVENTISHEGGLEEFQTYSAVRSQIMMPGGGNAEDDPIYSAVSEHIETERLRYGTETNSDNPWQDVQVEHWYEQMRLTLGVRTDIDIPPIGEYGEDDGGEEAVNRERRWLHSLAPIEQADRWPGERLITDGAWCIDGPFFLETTRLTLRNEHQQNLANASLLELVLSNCAGLLSAHLLADPNINHDILTTRTPFDILLKEDLAFDEYNPFHKILLYRDQDLYPAFHNIPPEMQAELERGWGPCVFPVPYVRVFSGRGFFVNVESQIIPPDRARYIPSSWRLGADDGAVPLVEWLSDQDAELLGEHWNEIPCSQAEGLRFLDENTAPLVKLIPPLTETEVYEKLEASGLRVPLCEQYPADGLPWFRPPLDDGIRALIFDAAPLQSPMLQILWQACLRSGVQSVQEDRQELIDVYRVEGGINWTRNRGHWTLTASDEVDEDWWTDRLIEILNKIQGGGLLDQDIRGIAPELNNSGSSWFAAECSSRRSGAGNRLVVDNGPALIRREIQRAEWSLMLETLNGWVRAAGGGGAGGGLWSMIDNDRMRIIDESDAVHFNDTEGELRVIGEGPISVIAGTPINPESIIDILDDLVITHSGNDEMEGVILFTNPVPCPEHLRLQLQQQQWTAIPNLVLVQDSDVMMNDRGTFGQPRLWHTFGGNVGTDFVRRHWKSYEGHALRVHSPRTRQNPRHDAIIREIGLLVISESMEFGDDVGLPYNRLVLRINQGRLSGGHLLGPGRRLSVDLVRTNKTGSTQPYGLRRGIVRTVRMNTALFDDEQEYVQSEHTQHLAEEGLCGFAEEVNRPLDRWLPNTAMLDLEELLNDEEEDADVIILGADEIVVPSIPEDEEVQAQLSQGIQSLLDQIVGDVVDAQSLIPLARYLAEISLLYGIAEPDPATIFEKMTAQGLNMNEEPRTGMIEAYEGIQPNLADDDLYLTQRVLVGLASLTGMTWDGVRNNIRDADGNPERQWEIFIGGALVPTNSVHHYDNEQMVFRRRGQFRAINPRTSFISEDDARRIFHISVDEEVEDAVSWIIPHHQRYIAIIADDISGMLDAPDARTRIAARWDPESLTDGLQDVMGQAAEAEPHPKWSFAQALLGLWAASRVEGDADDLRELIPSVVAHHFSQRCMIFEADGPEVRLGQHGWDLKVHENQFNLVTHNPDEASRGNLRNLLSGIGLADLIRHSLREEDGKAAIAGLLGVPYERVTAFCELFIAAGADLYNPFSLAEIQQWREVHGRRVNWEEDADRCGAPEDAREMLVRYRSAIRDLINREDMGPSAGSGIQRRVANLRIYQPGLVDALYPGIRSVILEEPIIHIQGEGDVTHHRIQRNLGSDERSSLLEKADLKFFPGNILLLTPFSSHRGTMTAAEFGLRERVAVNIAETVTDLIDLDEWGPDQHVTLRHAMQIGPENPVSLRLHKYHAILMAAMDLALDDLEFGVDEDE